MKLFTENCSLMSDTNTVMMAAILKLQPAMCMAHKRSLLMQWLVRLRQHVV